MFRYGSMHWYLHPVQLERNFVHTREAADGFFIQHMFTLEGL